MPIMNRLQSHGAIIVAILLLTFLGVQIDAQADSHTPGWMARFQRNVWCHTIFPEEEGNDFVIISHYPGKRLKRVLSDMNIPARQARAYLANPKRTTTCYRTWREAALNHGYFVMLTRGYEEMVMGWPESNFQQAMLIMTFRPEGTDLLQAAIRQQAEEHRQRRATPAAPRSGSSL